MTTKRLLTVEDVVPLQIGPHFARRPHAGQQKFGSRQVAPEAVALLILRERQCHAVVTLAVVGRIETCGGSGRREPVRVCKRVSQLQLQFGHVIVHGDHDLLDTAHPLGHRLAVPVERCLVGLPVGVYAKADGDRQDRNRRHPGDRGEAAHDVVFGIPHGCPLSNR